MNASAITTLQQLDVPPADLALLGDFAAGATHQLASPIGALLAHVEVGVALLGRPDGSARLPELFQRLRAECLRCQALLGRMRDLVNAIDELVDETNVDLGDTCRSAIEGAIGSGDCSADQTEFVEYEPASASWCLPRAALVRALEGLIRNAAQAGATNIHVSLAHDQHASIVCVRDDGPGIAEAIVTDFTQQFFRTRRPESLGLGLWFADQVARRSGGELSVENRPGGGCAVCVRLPRSRAA